MGRDWRAFHPDLPGEAGDEFELSPDETHHIVRVLRLGPGARVRVFDGAGTEWTATLIETGKHLARLRLQERLLDEVEAPIRVVLFQGQCRADRMDWVVQKATELGVAAIHVLIPTRSGAPAARPGRLERWRRIAVEAAKQSGRRTLPRIEPCLALPAAVPGLLALLLDPAAAETPVATLLADRPPGETWLAVGPESGFDPGEIRGALDTGWRATGLGPRVLRTETAGIVAASIVLHAWGDLGGPAIAPGPGTPV